MPLFLVRHGSTRLNAGDPADPRDFFRGWIDEPLSKHGQETGQATANWLKTQKVSLVVSSDLERARQTAHMIGKTTGAPVIEDQRLRPWNIGDLSGKEITPRRLKISDDLQKKTPDEPAPGGEPYNEFLKRYSGVVRELVQAASNHTVVAVAHHRNALALPHVLYGAPVKTKGPPEPGGVMQVGPQGMKAVYTPPAEKKIYNPKASS